MGYNLEYAFICLKLKVQRTVTYIAMKHQKLSIFSDPGIFQEKEAIYAKVRAKEGRILTDEAVLKLPESEFNSPHKKEWQFRKRSFLRLEAYLTYKFKGKISILDLGCGNGWMSGQLARNPTWKVVGIDLNMTELEQASRLFNGPNISFCYADIHSAESRNLLGLFDVVAMAASVQYFSDLNQLIQSVREVLKEGAEIHILDSPFYKNAANAAAARSRSDKYYESVGVPEMAQYYHHHLLQDALKPGAHDLNNRIGVWILQKTGWLAPFPWLRLKGQS
ncbi:MAG: class I SAM-dependent methyltransferase [Saprospiraceae bacterium]